MEMTETMEETVIVEIDVMIGEEPEVGVEFEIVENSLGALVAALSSGMLR
jgi:hypothetical protein